MTRSLFYPWRPVKSPPPRAARPDTAALLRTHERYFLWLGRRFLDYCSPRGGSGFGAEDLAQEFAFAAVRRLANWNPQRCGFTTWAFNVARSHAKYLRSKALRKKRARWAAGQFARVGGEEFDRFATTVDPRACEPWEIAAEREEVAG